MGGFWTNFFFREAGAKVVITTAKHEVIFTSLLKDIKGCEFNKLTKSTGKAQKNALLFLDKKLL